jgi:Asp-tRNA(Asn)/Glu-tRNA(Gln) amidotransferase B subunit
MENDHGIEEMKLKYNNEIWDMKMGPMPPSFLSEIIDMVEEGILTRPNAKKALDFCLEECRKAVVIAFEKESQ